MLVYKIPLYVFLLFQMFGAGGLFGGRSSGGDTVSMGLNTGGGSSAPGTADSAFAAWLHDQFTSRDDQMKDLTTRLNELLILQKEKSTSGAGVNIAMHQGGGGGGGLTEEVRIMGVESLSLLIFLGDIHIFIYIYHSLIQCKPDISRSCISRNWIYRGRMLDPIFLAPKTAIFFAKSR